MTKISRYVIDEKVTGSDKWIGSDAQTQYTTKNFTPTKLAVYFNENQIIDIGTPIRYKYDILEVGDTRLPGTITFEPQVGTPYSLSSISSFILSKYTLKGNDVTQYLNFLIGSNVLIYKADDINTFGLYKVVSLVENIAEPDFFDVVVSYTTGNGSILEDRDYLISLISPGGDIPTKTSDLINDGEDGVHPFITLEDITIPNLQQVTDEGKITTNSITVDSVDSYSIIETFVIATANKNTGSHTYLSSDGAVVIRTNEVNGLIKTTNLTEEITLEFPEKTTGIYTIATIEDLSDYVPYEGATQNVDLGVYDITAAHLIKDGGTASQFLKADGTVDSTTYLTSVGLTMPVAFNVANSPLTSDGTLAVTALGTASQYIRGDGQLATLPSGGGGGSSVNYYLNGSIAASVATYKQLSNTAIIGGGTDFTLTGNGLITQFLTDVGNPNRIEIPGGAWNFEMWFSMSSNGGTPKFYVELLKYNGTTFTTIANSSAVPETINGGTVIDLYLTSLAVPTTTLLSTDRLAVRVYIVGNSGGRTATLHTEDNHLCEILTTFSGGVTSLNGLTANTQYLAVGTTGTNFNISSVSETHTFNLPTASATNRGALSTTDWTAFNGKFNLPSLISGSVLFSNGTTIAQDNAQFFWDDTNNRLGIGTTSPLSKFHVKTKIDQNLRVSLGTTLEVNSINDADSAYTPITFRASSFNFANGNVGINTTAPTAKLHIAAPGALSTDIALRVRNSADTADLMTVTGTGQLGIDRNFGLKFLLSSVISAPSNGSILLTDAAGTSFLRLQFGGTSNLFPSIKRNTTNLEFKLADDSAFTGIISATSLVGGTSLNSSAALQVDSTTKGFLPPRMTNAQRLAIATPAVGLMVYCTDVVEGLYINKSTGWTFII